jgi:carbonic anhydrase
MKAIMVISCMDRRSDPAQFWKLGEGGPAVIRVAGGRAKDALRSIRTLAGIMSNGRNTVGAIAVVHHSDCGLINFSNSEVGSLLVERAGLSGERAEECRHLDFGSRKEYVNLASSVHGLLANFACSFPTVEDSLKEDLQIIKNDPYLPKDIEVIGYKHDVFTGKTVEVLSMK